MINSLNLFAVDLLISSISYSLAIKLIVSFKLIFNSYSELYSHVEKFILTTGNVLFQSQ
jgi:hypothetical protein